MQHQEAAMFTHQMNPAARSIAPHLVIGAALIASLSASTSAAAAPRATGARATGALRYEYAETRAVVALVNDAAQLVERDGEGAFAALRAPGSRWRQHDSYVFVLDPAGNMLVHPDPALEGKNDLALKDIDGRPIVRGLINAATAVPDKPEGWYHYRWPVPGAILPRWKSTYVRLVRAPGGRRYIVGSGMYDDRMERAFVIDMVKDAVARIEQRGEAAFPLFRDPTGPFLAKDAYVFVVDPRGVEVVNPAFPNLEGRPLLDVKDTQGKKLVREMFAVVRTGRPGWVDYMWPKPGDSLSTRKSTFVSPAKVGNTWYLVGAGVYLPGAPKAAVHKRMVTAPELMALVREGGSLLERRGEQAFPELRRKGSRWFRDDTYFFVVAMDGTRLVHAADPSLEGKSVEEARDILGRPYGKMFLAVGASRTGEGWVHYMYPEPGDIFPAWKSTFLERVTLPSGEQVLVGSAIYNMQMNRAFIEDVVGRASALIAARGAAAFDQLRDKTGPFRFMDIYVFVDRPDGVEIVNPGQPSLEGRNVSDLRDLKGKPVAREYIAAALERGAAWVDYWWYKPGQNTMAPKRAYVRKVQTPDGTFIVGSGMYLEH
jgi:signal transduction histidine kinase